MKRILIFMILIFIILYWLFISISWGGPFLISDPYPDAVGIQYEIKKDDTIILTGNNQSNGSIKFDLAEFSTGLNSCHIRYIDVDNLNQSTYIPFYIYKTISCNKISGRSQLCVVKVQLTQ